MDHGGLPLERASSVPEECLGDSDFEEYHEGLQPNALVKSMSGVVKEVTAGRSDVSDVAKRLKGSPMKKVAKHVPDIVEDVPEDGFDDSEFVEYLEGLLPNASAIRKGVSCTAAGGLQLPNDFTNCASNIVAETLSMSQTVQVLHILTDDRKDDSLTVDSVETACYMNSACSLLHKLDADYDAIRNIVTGGAADAWYPASSLWLEGGVAAVSAAEQGSSLGPSQPSAFGSCLYSGALVPVPLPVMTCEAATNQPLEPSSIRNATSKHAANGDIEAERQTEATGAYAHSAALVLERTPLRSSAALFQPLTKEEASPAKETAPMTTLMLRNLPHGCTRSVLMNMLCSAGFADHVVFIYLPMNLRKVGNFSYAFVDFDCMTIAARCKHTLRGFNEWSEDGLEKYDKPLEIMWSDTQGIDAHIQRYRDSPLMHPSLDDEFKPAVFKNGVRVDFPPPTKPLRAPRLRKDGGRSSQ